MKNFQIKHILTLLAVTLLMIACKTDPKKKYPANSIEFDTLKTEKTYHINNDAKNPSCKITMEYIYPTKADNPELLAKLQSELNYTFFEDSAYELQTPRNATDSFVFNYIENYINEAKVNFSGWETSGESVEYYSYSKTIESTIIYNQANILSYEVKTTDNKGTNKPFVNYKNVVINLKNGEVVQEKDIFVTGYKEWLNELLMAKFKEIHAERSSQYPFDTSHPESELFSTDDNFSVNENGITYIVNEKFSYKVTVMLDATRILLTYDEIKNYIKKDNPLQILIEN